MQQERNNNEKEMKQKQNMKVDVAVLIGQLKDLLDLLLLDIETRN